MDVDYRIMALNRCRSARNTINAHHKLIWTYRKSTAG